MTVDVEVMQLVAIQAKCYNSGADICYGISNSQYSIV